MCNESYYLSKKYLVSKSVIGFISFSQLKFTSYLIKVLYFNRNCCLTVACRISLLDICYYVNVSDRTARKYTLLTEAQNTHAGISFITSWPTVLFCFYTFSFYYRLTTRHELILIKYPLCVSKFECIFRFVYNVYGINLTYRSDNRRDHEGRFRLLLFSFMVQCKIKFIK